MLKVNFADEECFINDLIDGLIDADSAVCKVLVKARFCKCKMTV